MNQQRQPWTLSFRAKAKYFHFKLKASKMVPACKLLRISIQIKIRKYILEIKSKPDPAFSLLKSKSLKLKFLDILRNFKRRRSKNKGIGWFAPHKNYLCGRGNILRNWLWVVLLLVSCCIMVKLGLRLRYYFSEAFLWKLVWDYAAPSGFLHQFSKLLFV